MTNFSSYNKQEYNEDNSNNLINIIPADEMFEDTSTFTSLTNLQIKTVEKNTIREELLLAISNATDPQTLVILENRLNSNTLELAKLAQDQEIRDINQRIDEIKQLKIAKFVNNDEQLAYQKEIAELLKRKKAIQGLRSTQFSSLTINLPHAEVPENILTTEQKRNQNLHNKFNQLREGYESSKLTGLPLALHKFKKDILPSAVITTLIGLGLGYSSYELTKYLTETIHLPRNNRE